MPSIDRQEAVDMIEELRQKLDQLQELFGEIDEGVRFLSRELETEITYERFRSYPKAHITMHLGPSHEYAGNAMCTVEDILAELEDCIGDEENPDIEEGFECLVEPEE